MAYTMDSVRRFMAKQQFSEEMICYIFRRDGSTHICLLDGREPETQIPLGHFEKYLPAGRFLRANKDVLLAAGQVINVTGGKYLMTNGAVLDGRHHGTRCHTEFRRKMEAEQASESAQSRLIREKCSAYDSFPFPFCVSQMVFDPEGRETTFLFRYCNRAMADLAGCSAQEMLGRSYFDLFPYASGAWTIEHGDLVKNGGCRVSRVYSPRRKTWLTVVAYRVAPGFCACVLYEDGRLNVLDPTFCPNE